MQKAFGVCMCVITEKILNLVMSSELDIHWPSRATDGGMCKDDFIKDEERKYFICSGKPH